MEILLLNSKRSQLERIAGPERRSCYVWRCFAFMLLVWFRKLVTIRVTLWYTGIHLAKWWASIAFCVIKESINREKDKVHGQGCQPASCWATATCRYWCQPFGEGGREYLAKFLKLIFWEEVGLSKLYSWPLGLLLKQGALGSMADDVLCSLSPGHDRDVPALRGPLLQNVSFWVLTLFWETRTPCAFPVFCWKLKLLGRGKRCPWD